MNYHIVTDPRLIDEAKWSDFVASHPNGNIFQTPAFVSFISETKFYRPVVIAALTDSGTIKGVLTGVLQNEKAFIKSLFSTRLIVWGGPITLADDGMLTNLLIQTLVKNYQNQCIYIEFRNFFPLNDFSEIFRKNGFEYSEHLNYIVDTTYRDQTIKRISSGKNRQIRKSLKNGAKILDDVSIEQVSQFYEILKKLFKSKVKKPLPEWDFFERFHSHKELGRYLLIEFKGAIVGGIMCPVFRDSVIYEWYIAGEDGVHEGIYPSILATWAPIEYALDHGYKLFDFMGAGKPDADYGVREFKATFGGELVSFGRYNRVNNKLLYFIGKTGLKLLNYFKK